MKVAHCVECNNYKYIVKNGRCRDCNHNDDLNLGICNNKQVSMKKSSLYRNMNISGVTGCGKTELAKHIVKQYKNHSICYFNFQNDVNNDDMNIKTISDNCGFTLLNPIRNEMHSKYQDEIKIISNYIYDLIQNNVSCYISPRDALLLSSSIKLIIDSKKYNTFKAIHDCIIDKTFRKSIFDNSSNKLKIQPEILKISINPSSDIIYTLDNLTYMDNIISNNDICIKKLIDNNKKYIFNFDIDTPYEIAILLIDKIYTEMDVQQNIEHNIIFCLDEIDNFSNMELLEKHYRHSRHYHAGFINIFEYLSNKPQFIFNQCGIYISFRHNSIQDSDKLSKLININKMNIQNIKNCHYILSSYNKSSNIYPIHINI